MIYSFVLAVVLFFQASVHFLTSSGVDPEIKPYWDKEVAVLEDMCGKKIEMPSKVYVDFGDTEGAIGYCQPFLNGFKIILSKPYWDKVLDRVGKRQLLLHEMMHCIFKEKHNTLDPTSFMYPEYTEIKEEALMAQVYVLVKKNERCR